MFSYFQFARSSPTRVAETMETRITSILWVFFIVYSVSSSPIASANELSLVIGLSDTLQLPRGSPVENSPGSKPGTSVVCERVQIHGLSRLQNLKKFAHSVKLKVLHVNTSARPPKVEVCLHRNISLGLGMCPQGQWEKLVKGSWVKSMSPFDHKLLDIRVAGSSLDTLLVNVEEELFLYRIVFLVLGIVMMTLAPSLSKSLVFYYSSAMAVGVILVILMVLFQGMKLLPTGRKNSLAIFVYSSLVGLGSFLLRYLPRLLHSVLVEIGISEDMYNPLALFLVVFVVLTGAWLGFWVVRKFVLTEDGSIDIGISDFVGWSIRIFAAIMILQSSVDPLLAVEALACGILVSSILRKITSPRFARHFYKKLCRTDKSKHRRSQVPSSSPIKNSYGEYINDFQSPANYDFLGSHFKPFGVAPCNTTPLRGLTRTPPTQLSASDTCYSSFHTTPERRKFSRDEWEKFTKDSTKKALEELVSSPDFSKWAIGNAERITLAPNKEIVDRRQSWFRWFSS